MIKKGLKLLLFVFIFAVAVIYLRFGCEDSNAIDVMPKVVGSASTDSVRITFCTTDTGYYPTPTDADSLELLVYPPDNAAVDSTGENATGLFNLSPGYYQYHRRGSNSAGDLGAYCLYVKAWYGGARRGNETITWFVDPAGTYHYGVQDSTRDFVDTEVADIKTKTDNLPSDPADQSLLMVEVQNLNGWNPFVNVMSDSSADSIELMLSHRVAIGDTVGRDCAVAGNQMDLTAGAETKVYNQCADADHDSGWTATRAGYLDYLDEPISGLDDNPWDDATRTLSTYAGVWNFDLSGEAYDGDSSKAGDYVTTKALADYDPPTRAEATSDKDAIITEVDANETKIDALDDNPWDNAKSDTASGMGDWFADWFKANYWLTASGFSTFDPATDTVSYVDSLIEPLTLTSVDSVRKVYIVDSLDQTVTAEVDTEANARSVWNDDIVSLANRTVTANCAGTGENTFIVTILDDADSSALYGFVIQIEDSITGSPLRYRHTNSAGVCTFAVDDGHYTLYLRAPGWSITSPVYRTITDNDAVTYYATGLSPSPPPVDSVCVVWGRIKNKDGSPALGAKVEIWMDVYGVTYHGDLIDAMTPTIVYTDTLGEYEFSSGVYPNDLLLPADTKWKIRVTTDYRIWEGKVEVPVADSWQVDITLP